MPKELLFSITKKDLKIDFFSGTGAGGQYRNKHQNCVRLHHMDSGVIVTGQSSRSRTSNMEEALNGLVSNPKFKLWHKIKCMEMMGAESIEKIVERLMAPENIKVETMNEKGEWVESR